MGNQADLSSIWRRTLERAAGESDNRRLKVVNESGVPIPLEIFRFWQDVADDRGISALLRVLPFTSISPFGETIDGKNAVVYASPDPRVTPPAFIRSNGVHELRHLEQHLRPWLIDEKARECLIRDLLKADGLTKPDDNFFARHHAHLPEEIDAFSFEHEVAGFLGDDFSTAVRAAMQRDAGWPDPKEFTVPVTRRILVQDASADSAPRMQPEPRAEKTVAKSTDEEPAPATTGKGGFGSFLADQFRAAKAAKERQGR